MDGGGGGVISGQSARMPAIITGCAIVSRSIIGTGKDTQQRGRNGHEDQPDIGHCRLARLRRHPGSRG
jgi:hypothetical protein